MTGTMKCFKIRRKVKFEFMDFEMFSEKEIVFLFVVHMIFLAFRSEIHS